MIVASIDIGTNTVLLLIAEIDKKSRKLQPIRNEYRMPRIGKGVKETGIISNEKVYLLLDVLEEYKSFIIEHHCEKVIITGTNALRLAQNAKEIKKLLRQRFNYDLEVVSGDTEAEYAYLGTISDFDKCRSNLVIDIGGGSSELIFGDELSIKFKRSLQIGSVSATEQFLKNIPPTEKETKSLMKEVESLLAQLKIENNNTNVIAIAGTATTISAMNLGLKEFVEDKIEMSKLTQEEIKKIINELKRLSSIEIAEKYGIITNGREDIILAGALILFEIMNYFGIKKLGVSSRGIRYGAIVKNLLM